MATVDKEIADRVAAGKYSDDNPLKIVRYTNAWGGDAYGVISAGEDPNRYAASNFVINPTVYWEAQA